MYLMNTATTTIHKAELLKCGCRVCPNTGARFITCSSHAKMPAVDPLKKKDGMHPLCPVCASQHIKPAGINILCVDCDALFSAPEIIGYGLSDDGEARQCHLCNTIYRGTHDCTQMEQPS